MNWMSCNIHCSFNIILLITIAQVQSLPVQAQQSSQLLKAFANEIIQNDPRYMGHRLRNEEECWVG